MANLKNTRYDEEDAVRLIIDALEMYDFFNKNASGKSRTNLLAKINHALSTYGKIFPGEFSYVKKERDKKKARLAEGAINPTKQSDTG